LWIPLALSLGGCQPARVDVDVRSASRVEETVSVDVDSADRDVARAALRRLLPADWTEDTPEQHGDVVSLRLRRTVDPHFASNLRLSHRSMLFGLRREFTLHAEVSLSPLPADHPLLAALKGQSVTVAVHMPGRIRSAQGGTIGPHHGAAVWTTTIDQVLGAPLNLDVTSRTWRKPMLLALLVVLAVLLWVLWPAIMPPPAVRAERRAKRDARRQLRAQVAEKKAAARAAAQERAAKVKAARDAKASAKASAKAARLAAKEVRAAKATPAPEVHPFDVDGPAAQAPEEPAPSTDVKPRRGRGPFGRRRAEAKAEPVAEVAAEPVVETEPEPVIEPQPEPEPPASSDGAPPAEGES
jgi:hypothetical protein